MSAMSSNDLLTALELCAIVFSTLFDNLAKLFSGISFILMEFTNKTNIYAVLGAFDLMPQFLGFIEMIRH